MPRNLRTPCTFSGVGKFRTETLIRGVGLRPLAVIICPKYLTSFLTNIHFQGFNFRLAAFSRSITFRKWKDGLERSLRRLRYRQGRPQRTASHHQGLDRPVPFALTSGIRQARSSSRRASRGVHIDHVA